MKYFSHRNLTIWIVILPLAGVIFTAILLIEIFIEYKKEIYEESIGKIREDTIKHNKILAQERVNVVVDFIHKTEEILRQDAHNEIKITTQRAIESLEKMYKRYSYLPKWKLISKMQGIFRDQRFYQNSIGHFFIYDLNGKLLLFPPNKSLEQKNMLNETDARGIQIIRQHIDLIKNQGEGFVTSYEKISSKKRLGYIKYFKPLDIYIGNYNYQEHINHTVIEKLQLLLNNINYGYKSYIFIYDYKGNIISHKDPVLINTNIWNETIENEYITRNLIKGAQAIQEGFFMSYLVNYDPVGKKNKYKNSFIKDIPHLNWVVGTGTYYEDLLQEIKSKHQKLDTKLKTIISYAYYAIIIVLGLILVSTLIISIKLNKVLKNYQKSLINKNKKTLQQKEALLYQLEHDQLTHLPNRMYLKNKLEQSIKLSKRDKRNIAIMFIDVDKFKLINDSLGHDAGDKLLKEVALRLKTSIRESDIVARFGGDEFVMMIDNYKNINNIVTIINKIQSSLKKPISFGKNDHQITLSIGISIFPNDGKNTETLLKNADIAMYRAKESGRDGYKFFTNVMHETIQKEINIEKSLQKAIKDEEFILYYQPLIDTNNKNKILGVEALIRWKDPNKGLIFPDEFMPIAEDNNLIINIGKWVIKQAMQQMVKWKNSGYEIQKIAINIANNQLEDSHLIDYIKDMLEETQCQPQWIEFEIVERFVMKNPIKSIRILKKLRDMNIDISIDDFGTGYSSLYYLKRLPITKLKIDKMFVSNMLKSIEDRAIAKMIVTLGKELQLNVLAEGVETMEQQMALKAISCHYMQGYLFDKPLPADVIQPILEKGYINIK